MGDDLIQKFGYTEMYEWSVVPDNKNRLGRFVTFDPKNEKDKSKILPYSKKGSYVLGVTSVNSVIESDNPNEWKYKNLCNEYGDLYLKPEKLAVGEKVYDQYNEMNYIKTRPWEHFITMDNKYYDKEKKYVKRTNRIEWIRVTVLGKCIVADDGTCKAGEFCTPYTGKIKEKQGIAIPASDKDTNKYYVLARLSDSTILIYFK